MVANGLALRNSATHIIIHSINDHHYDPSLDRCGKRKRNYKDNELPKKVKEAVLRLAYSLLLYRLLKFGEPFYFKNIFLGQTLVLYSSSLCHSLVRHTFIQHIFLYQNLQNYKIVRISIQIISFANSVHSQILQILIKTLYFYQL